MLLMVGVEAGEVAQGGDGAGGAAAAAVAVGAHGAAGGQHGVAQLEDVGRLDRLEVAARRARFSSAWSRFIMVTQALVNRSSVQIACKRPWAGLSLRSSRTFGMPLRGLHEDRGRRRICFIEIRPMFGLVAGVEGLLAAGSSVSRGST